MDSRLLEILCCPITRRSLNRLGQDDLEQVNNAIRQGNIRNHGGVELTEPLGEALVTEDPATWREYTRDLHDVGVILLNAVEARDVDALFNGGETLDQACEACHQHYWYPGF